MKILIIGLGSIGQRHLKNIKKVKPQSRIAVLRQHSKKEIPKELKSLVECVFLKSQEALRWKPDIVFVTNPAPFHVQSALSFARNGSHLFVEKPLGVSLKEIDRLLKTCAQKRLVLMVGYVLRFLKPLKLLKEKIDQGTIGKVLSIRAAVGRSLPDWRPGDYRRHVSAQKKLGGGVVFELSHELDYVRWLAGEIKEVHAVMDRVSRFDIDTEDVAEINLRFKNRAIGNIHLDMVDLAANRSCRVIGEKGTLMWDTSRGQGTYLYSNKNKKWKTLWEDKSYDRNDMYLEELRHFFHCIQKKEKPLVSGHDGRRVVELILDAKRSSQNGKSH